VVLATASRARISLLASAGVAFTPQPASIDERAIEAPLVAAGKSPAAIATALSEAKALAVSRRESDALVIGADQVLELDGRRWTKPRLIEEARTQLERLSGRTHALQTAMACAQDGTVIWHHLEIPRLTMRVLSQHHIDAYLTRVGERALESVGSYQIEREGIGLFERIDGDYFAILGLPLLPLLAFLRSEGAIE
jgi:septum formation protein